MSGDFEKNSLDWQLHLWQIRIAEWVERLFQSSNNNPSLPNWSFPEWLLQRLFWALAIALSLWALWQLYSILAPYLGTSILANSQQPTATTSHPERRTTAEWHQRSRLLAQQGNYREACRALYQATLQHLDIAGLIPGEASRTDGEYLRRLQTLPNPHPYQILIRTHEQLCFSHMEVTQETFEHCEQAYREIETL
ncbi:hypothetical protein OsccyDRAFT_2063 [Leptolyngbyaceae cyanobacterium JSC-12]|nr:hypothetical protein OsccyDRAFT_2063 [Leptolyngbyaceae cyanobacterium JSC-12]